MPEPLDRRPDVCEKRSTAACTDGSAAWSGSARSRLSRLPATHAERSGSLSQRASVRQVRLIIRGQSSMLLGYGLGGQSRFLSASLVPVGLDEADEGRVEARREVPHLLEHDPARLEDRGGGGVVQAERRAVDV